MNNADFKARIAAIMATREGRPAGVKQVPEHLLFKAGDFGFNRFDNATDEVHHAHYGASEAAFARSLTAIK